MTLFWWVPLGQGWSRSDASERECTHVHRCNICALAIIVHSYNILAFITCMRVCTRCTTARRACTTCSARPTTSRRKLFVMARSPHSIIFVRVTSEAINVTASYQCILRFTSDFLIGPCKTFCRPHGPGQGIWAQVRRLEPGGRLLHYAHRSGNSVPRVKHGCNGAGIGSALLMSHAT